MYNSSQYNEENYNDELEGIGISLFLTLSENLAIVTRIVKPEVILLIDERRSNITKKGVEETIELDDWLEIRRQHSDWTNQ